MKNTRALISSSVVPFVIMILGLFMLCMSRAPRISFDEPLVEGGGVAPDTVGVNDQDFLSLLDKSNDNTPAVEKNNQVTSNDSDFLRLLNSDEEDLNTNSSNQSVESGDEGMDEILRLLDTNDDSSSITDTQPSNTNQQSTTTEFSESSNQGKVTASPNKEAVDQLSKEIENLEDVLANKTTEVESLQVTLNSYDRKINEYEYQISSSKRNKTPVRKVSYSEGSPSEKKVSYSEESPSEKKVSYSEESPSEKSVTNDNYASSSNYSSSNFEGSYNRGLTLFQNHEYPQAIDVFFQLIQENPQHPLAGNCQYWLGEARFAQGNYYQAVAEFNKVFAFDSADKQDDAQLMIGLAYMKLGELSSARTEFDWLVSCYGSSEYADTAHHYLGQF